MVFLTCSLNWSTTKRIILNPLWAYEGRNGVNMCTKTWGWGPDWHELEGEGGGWNHQTFRTDWMGYLLYLKMKWIVFDSRCKASQHYFNLKVDATKKWNFFSKGSLGRYPWYEHNIYNSLTSGTLIIKMHDFPIYFAKKYI